MILRPPPQREAPARRLAAPLPVWEAVEETQRRRAEECWAITQPDHAALAGDIAANLGPPLLPRLAPEVVQGVAVHDDGWGSFDAQVGDDRPPVSFLNLPPVDFLRAWRDSIERGEGVAPIAGILVSRHFRRIGQARLDSAIDNAENLQRLREFLEGEKAREFRLLPACGEREDRIEFLVDVLQFCDLLSLYLCCGAEQDVEFPQKLASRPLRLMRASQLTARPAHSQQQAALCQFDPSPFASGVGLAVMARRFPGGGAPPGAATLPFLLW